MRFSLVSGVALLSCISGLTSAAALAASDVSAASSTLQSVGIDIKKFRPIIGDPSFTCKVLGLLFPKNETFTTSSPSYTPLYEEPWSQTCWEKPACIVTPKDEKELSIIVKVVGVLRTKFAVRSGGHKPTPGFNSIDSHGVLIALEKLGALKLSSDKKTMTVGTGLRWANVYDYLKSEKLLVGGGRVPLVGTGGFLLGGGFNLFTNSWGLGLDMVTRFKVVLADGSIVNACPSEHSDLYHALKGGQSNLGIVTEFELLTKPDSAWFTVKAYSPNSTQDVLDAYGRYLSNPNTDPKSSIQLGVGTQVNPDVALAFFGYEGGTSEPKDFADFDKIPAVQVPVPPTSGSLGPVLKLGGTSTTLGNWVGVGYTHKVPNGDFLKRSNELIQAAAKKLPKDMYITYTPQGVLPNLAKVGKELNGGNVFGIEETSQVWVDLFMTYKSGDQTSYATKVINDLYDQITSEAKSKGLFLPYIFANTASATQDVLHSFGEQNYQTIATAAKKYDPKGVFQTLQNDGYLLS